MEMERMFNKEIYREEKIIEFNYEIKNIDLHEFICRAILNNTDTGKGSSVDMDPPQKTPAPPGASVLTEGSKQAGETGTRLVLALGARFDPEFKTPKNKSNPLAPEHNNNL